jgi:hypothetical protein
MEVFDLAETFRKLAGRLVASYALDAMERLYHGAPPDLGVVRAFIEAVRAAPRRRSASVGIGAAVRLSTDALVGAALEVAGGCAHLAAFRRQTLEDQSGDRGFSESRMARMIICPLSRERRLSTFRSISRPAVRTWAIRCGTCARLPYACRCHECSCRVIRQLS